MRSHAHPLLAGSYPTSDEHGVAEGRRGDFRHGSITFNARPQATTATFQ